MMEMFNRHPQNIAEPKKISLTDAIEACLNSSQVCTACSDARLAEKEVDQLRSVIPAANHSRDSCFATPSILSRLNYQTPKPLQSLITACIEQVQHTSLQCNEHAHRHEH